MGTAKKCDSCGALYENNNEAVVFAFTTTAPKTAVVVTLALGQRDLGAMINDQSVDVCDECLRAIKDELARRLDRTGDSDILYYLIEKLKSGKTRGGNDLANACAQALNMYEGIAARVQKAMEKRETAS